MGALKLFFTVFFFIAGVMEASLMHASGAFELRNNDEADVTLQKVFWDDCADDVFSRGKVIIHPGMSYEISWSVSPPLWEGPFHDPVNCKLTRIKFTKLQNGLSYPFEFSFDSPKKVPNDHGRIVCEFNSRTTGINGAMLNCWKESKGKMIGEYFSGIWDPSW